MTRAARRTAGAASRGSQQLTPTAITWSLPAATAKASASGCPARVRGPATVYDSHTGTPQPAAARSRASASSASGTVSRARASGAAAASASIRGRWKRSSSATVRPYRPRYSPPSASTAPYGPTEAATHTGPPAAPAAARARATLRRSRASVSAPPSPRRAKPGWDAW